MAFLLTEYLLTTVLSRVSRETPARRAESSLRRGVGALVGCLMGGSLYDKWMGFSHADGLAQGWRFFRGRT